MRQAGSSGRVDRRTAVFLLALLISFDRFEGFGFMHRQVSVNSFNCPVL